jgi:hypothetical protein
VTILDSNNVTLTGQVTVWGGFNVNERNQNSTFTLTAKLAGSDGSTISMHQVQHFAANANGDITVNVDNTTLTCG